MIYIDVDCKEEVRKIQKQLGDMAPKAPTVLSKALNDTAKDARKLLYEEAQQTYVVKSGRFNKAMKIKNASASKLTAVITATGSVMELKDFKVSPAGVPSKDAKPELTKGKVLKTSSMKALIKGDLKAFVAKFKSGHVSVVQRRGASRLPLKKLLSPSIPTMLGNEDRVYGIVEPQIEELLQTNIQKQIAKLLGGTT